jgi:hypothetical protein
MTKCNLCSQNDADKSGSHIISDFILRSMLVDDNTSTRSEKIISNRIDSIGTDLFLGRGIQQEKVNELIGRDLTDEDLSKNINHYTVDNILCSNCEKRLSHLESLFKENIFDSIKKHRTLNNGIELPPENTNTFKLFWLSIIWRCSIIKFDTFRLDSKSESKLGRLLDSSLGNSLKETKELIERNGININREVLGVLFVKEFDDYLTNIVFCNPFLKTPYVLVLNDFYIFYYSKEGHVKSIKQSMYRLDRLFKPDDYINLGNCKSIKIGIVPAENFIESRSYIYGLKVQDFLENIIQLFRDSYSLLFGSNPSREIIAEFVDSVVNKDDINVFERYKTVRIHQKIKEILTKYIG